MVPTGTVDAEASKFVFYEHEFEYERDHGMNREYGAEEACKFVKRLDFDATPPGDKNVFQ